MSDFEKTPARQIEEKPCALFFNPACFYWAMRNIDIRFATMHLLLCGATGTGKTTIIKLFLQSIAQRFKPSTAPRSSKPKEPEQLILYNDKGDMIPFLAALGLNVSDPSVHLFNAYDSRSSYWDIAAAVQEPMMARFFAEALIPEERESSNPYFPDGARELVYATILGLSARLKTKWDLRDLLCALQSAENVKAITAHDPRAKLLAERLIADEKHFPGLLSTIGTKLGKYEQVAALLHSNEKKKPFSISQFLSDPGVLIVGTDPLLRASLWPINALFLKALTYEILRRQDTHSPRHWFAFDEFRAMEKLDCIHDLGNRGRSKGVSLLLAVQSVEQLQEIYSEAETEDILGECAHKTFLRAGAPTTAEWAERVFAKVRYVERSVNYSYSDQGCSSTEQFSIQERSLFGSSTFTRLPFPATDGQHWSICDVPSLNRALIVRREFSQLLSWCKKPADVPAVLPRSDSKSQNFKPWTKREVRRFCGTPDTAGEGKKEKKTKSAGPASVYFPKPDEPSSDPNHKS